MLGRKESWFHRNRGFILGFALVVAVLNIVLFVAMPTESAVEFSGEVREYSTSDESVVQLHAVEFAGTLTSRAFRPTEFEGTLTLDGAAWSLRGTHADGAWAMEITAQSAGADAPAVLAVRGDRELSGVVVLLGSDTDVRFLSLRAGNRDAALRNFHTWFSDITHR